MANDEHTFPEDWGTDLQDIVDYNDAAAFANHADHPNLRGYVATGFELSPNFDTDSLSISEGQAYLWRSEVTTNDHSGEDGPGPKTLGGGLFKVQRGASGDINLIADATNHIFVRAKRTSNDTVIFTTNTDGSQPTSPSLLIGRVDTANGEYYHDNRAPAAQNQRLVVTGDTHGADY